MFPLITSSIARLYLGNSNEWILLICWWLTIRFWPNHTHGARWEVSTGRRPVQRMSDVEASVGATRPGWVPKRSWHKTQFACSGYLHLHQYLFHNMTLSFTASRPWQNQADGVSLYLLCVRWCFSRTSVCGGSPVGMKAGCWSCMLARACW